MPGERVEENNRRLRKGEDMYTLIEHRFKVHQWVGSDGKLKSQLEDQDGNPVTGKKHAKAVFKAVANQYQTNQQSASEAPWTLSALPRGYQEAASVTQALGRPRLVAAGDKIYATVGAVLGMNVMGYTNDRLSERVRQLSGIISDGRLSHENTTRQLQESDFARRFAYGVVWRGITDGLEQYQQQTGLWLYNWVLTASEKISDPQLQATRLEIVYQTMPENLRDAVRNAGRHYQSIGQTSTESLPDNRQVVIRGDHQHLFEFTQVLPDELSKSYTDNPLLKGLRYVMRGITIANLNYTQRAGDASLTEPARREALQYI